jgi:hypothetical protein
MALTLYTKPENEKLIEDIKIKALKEKLSVSEVTLQLLQRWVKGDIKLDNHNRSGK